MIRLIARCPYCLKGEIGIDDNATADKFHSTAFHYCEPAIIFDPDRARRLPCPHLAFVFVTLVGYLSGRSGHWTWVRGEGLRSLPFCSRDLYGAYVERLAGNLREFHPGRKFELVPNTGNSKGSSALNGWTIYAPAPARLVKLVREMESRPRSGSS